MRAHWEKQASEMVEKVTGVHMKKVEANVKQWVMRSRFVEKAMDE